MKDNTSLRAVIVLAAAVAILGLAAGSANAELTHLWKLDGDATDSVGGYVTLTEYGSPTYVTGVFGQAVSLDGATQYLAQTGTADPFEADNVTFSMWIQHSGLPAGRTAYPGGTQDCVLYWLQPNGIPQFVSYRLPAAGAEGTIPTDGTWVNLMGTISLTEGAIKLYLDGHLASSVAYASNWAPREKTHFAIGGRSDRNPVTYLELFGGLIDDVAVFDHVITRPEMGNVIHLGAEHWDLFYTWELAGAAEWATANWHDGTTGGQLPPAKRSMIIDVAGAEVTLAGDANTVGVYLGQNNTASLTVPSTKTLEALWAVDVHANGNLSVDGTLICPDVIVYGALTTGAAADVSGSVISLSGGSLTAGATLTTAGLTYNAGTLDLAGHDLNAGALTANADLDLSGAAVSAATAVTVNNAVLTLGNAVATGTLTLDGGNIAGAGGVTADTKYAFTNVADYSGDLTGATAELVIGEARASDATVKLSGTNNTYGGTTTIKRGVLEVSANAANLGSGPLVFNSDTDGEPAILQTSGTFARNIGTGAGEVSWSARGGFAASDAPLTVTLNGGATIDWSASTGFNGIRPLHMGSPTSTAAVTLANSINLGAARYVWVFDNPNTSADIAILSGDLVAANQHLVKQGDGTLWLTGNNNFGAARLQLSGGVVRAEDGVGLPSNAIVFFWGGILESSGTFDRQIGLTSGSGDTGRVVWWDYGGFAAGGGPAGPTGALTVSLIPAAGGSAGDPLTWSGDLRSKNLYMGSPTADNVVTLTNPIDCGGGSRYIYVSGNPDVDTDYAVLSGNITNVGTLYVRGTSKPGELRFTGSVTATTVQVETGATLGGSGTITGKLTVASAGAVAPGDGLGTLTVTSNTTLSAGSIYAWQVGQPGETDTLHITGGTLTLGDFVLKILDADGYVASAADQLPVFTYSGATIDMSGFLDDFDTSALDGTWTIGSLALTDDLAGTIYLTGLSGGALDFLPGDADGDGDVDAADYVILKANMGTPSGAVLADGDFDVDGDVDWDDLQILQGNYGATSPGAAGTIPEPATLGLLAIGAIAALRRRRRS